MVVSAATDWSMELSTYPMSVMMAFGGISAALVGKWQMKVIFRKSLLTYSPILPHSLNYLLTFSLTPLHTYTLTHLHTYSLTHLLTNTLTHLLIY